MIATVHIGRIGRLALMFGVGVAVASGYGCSSAWADPDVASSSEASSLLGLATSDFDSILGDLSPSATSSSDEVLNGLVTGADTSGSVAASTADGPFASLLTLIDGVSPAPSTPGDLVGFSGSPSLLGSLTLHALDLAKPLEKLLGIDFTSTIAPLLAADSPPAGLESMSGITVTESQYDGMPVYDLTPADPSGDYVVAIHGGAYVDEPTLLHWLAYTDMAHDTGATVVVPIYPLAGEGGSAGTVEPEIASLISSEIATPGVDQVSVFGDSAGGGIALSAVELMVKDGDVLPNSMVLTSPALDNTLTNPDISLVNDPVLNVPELQQDALLWADGLQLNNPEVSPIDGSLVGLPDTYVYSGSDELLAPDVLALEQDAIAQDAPISFILRTGEIHDWALLPIGDGAQVQQQIYQELGLTGAGTSASTVSGDLSTEWGSVVSTLSTDMAHALSTWSTDLTALSSDFSGIVQDVLALF